MSKAKEAAFGEFVRNATDKQLGEFIKAASPPTHEEDPILDIEDAAKQLGRAPQTIRNWIAQGAMRYVRMPNGIAKVRQSEVNIYLRPRCEEVK